MSALTNVRVWFWEGFKQTPLFSVTNVLGVGLLLYKTGGRDMPLSEICPYIFLHLGVSFVAWLLDMRFNKQS